MNEKNKIPKSLKKDGEYIRMYYSHQYERMKALEEQLLKFSNDIRLQDDITIIETRFVG